MMISPLGANVKQKKHRLPDNFNVVSYLHRVDDLGQRVNVGIVLSRSKVKVDDAPAHRCCCVFRPYRLMHSGCTLITALGVFITRLSTNLERKYRPTLLLSLYHVERVKLGIAVRPTTLVGNADCDIGCSPRAPSRNKRIAFSRGDEKCVGRYRTV